jgi:putative transposase
MGSRRQSRSTAVTPMKRLLRGITRELGTAIEFHQGKYFNNIVKQDHWAVKRVNRSMLGFKLFVAVQANLIGIELMPMLKIGQLVGEPRGRGLTLAEQFYALAA